MITQDELLFFWFLFGALFGMYAAYFHMKKPTDYSTKQKSKKDDETKGV